MPRLARANDGQVAAIYRESHALWGTGLTLQAYRGLWDEISRLPWAVRHAEFLVWQGPAGEVLSSLKLYRPLVRVEGRVSRASVLGAVFTPRARRGRGHASRMLRAVLERIGRRSRAAVLLFSDIGTAFYARFGFHPLPAMEHWGPIPDVAGPQPDGWKFRDASGADLGRIREAHHASCLRRPLAVIRDEEHWEFLRARTRCFFARIDDPELRPRFLVASRRGRFAGYLVTVEGRGECSLREIGARAGDPGILAQVFRAAACEARGRGLRRFCAWLPPELALGLRDWPVSSQPRRRALPMVHVPDSSFDLKAIVDPRRSFLPYQDQF
jgi:ribosomal protein S18 acetylase RimI-like enzyme